jgi:hypothetical protein
MASIHVSLKEIRGKTHSNPRNHTKNKGTKNKHEKNHENHNAESSIQTRKDSQGQACRPRIHTSQQISHEALMLVLEKMEKKIAKENEKWEGGK